ncbi:MAG: ATP-binding cassette domain-containing protein, partial [Mesorhizobium sp.]
MSEQLATGNLLEVRGLTKIFGSLTACDHIDLTIARGEIHALLGENGAGKSTLVKMLFGSLEPHSGEILWQGQPVRIQNPGVAKKLGIGMVFQHFSLFEALTAAENIALSLDDGSPINQIAAKARALSYSYGLPLDPDSLVGDLSVGERQRIEIIRCLLQLPQLIILDEPTSVLTPQEADKLFETLERLRAEGKSILYISHRLEEVKRICDRATVLRHGKV